ncbi:hypothetical protein ACWJJH_04770 [Endozoicomonadaceae bacterium StTr2]
MKNTKKFILSTAVVAAIAANAGISQAADDGDMRWSTRIEPVCGIQIKDGQGGIGFRRDNYNNIDNTTFTITSNNWMTGPFGPKPSAYVKVDLDSVSSNFDGRVNEHNAVFMLKSRATHNNLVAKTIDVWDGASHKTIMPNGEYNAWMMVPVERSSMPAGEASIVTTVTVSCPL